MRKIGVASILFISLIGCTGSRDAKLRREIQCRTFADKDLSELRKSAGDDDHVTLQESFYSESENTCIAAFEQHGTQEDPKGGFHSSTAYSAYESVSFKKLLLFIRADTDNVDFTDGEKAVPMARDAKTVFNEKLKQFR